MEKESKQRSLIWRNLIMGMMLAVMIFSGTGLVCYGLESHRQQQEDEQLMQLASGTAAEKTEDTEAVIPVDFEALRAENPEVVGWIRIPDTKIDYPILYCESDNEKYLHTDFHGNESTHGAIYLDSDSEPDFNGWNHPIYGHHMKDGSMFKDVVRFKDPAYFKEHQYFEIYTPKRTIHLKAVSCYYTGSDGIVRKTKFQSQESYDSWLRERLEPCGYAQMPEVSVASVFTLVTCSYEKEDARTLLFAVEVDGERNVIPAESRNSHPSFRNP